MRNIWIYSCIVFFVNLFGIFLTITQLKLIIDESDSYGKKLSIVSLSWSLLWNAFLFFAHIMYIFDVKVYIYNIYIYI